MASTAPTSAAQPAQAGLLARRLRPLRIGVFCQSFLLWVPVEKVFMTHIGFDAASIGVMAAVYAGVVPLLEIPSGILADRWSRSGVMILASVALAASSLLGGLSDNVATYVAAAVILGVFFALSSGTVDSIVYDAVVEETGSSSEYKRWIGRIHIGQAAALAISSVAGGLLAALTSPRITYFATVPLLAISVLAFLRFCEPQLHRAAERVPVRQHVAAMLHATRSTPAVRQVMLLAALAALLAQAIFEFGPLWLVRMHAPLALYGPYWAVLVTTGGLAGYLTSKVDLGHRAVVLTVGGAVAGAAVLLQTTTSLLAVVVAQTLLTLSAAMVGIHAGFLMHDSVPANVRAGVSSCVGTLSWLLFLPFSLLFGWLTRSYGLHWSSLGVTIIASTLALLLAASTRRSARRSEDFSAAAVATRLDFAAAAA
jgi:predicted MFS family arabinose efflux permease